ncbi:SpvB/TcaC N-terminal domain-containing protein [Pseudomonas nunensis]|uniref:SpvB/TcaC N-terminal domain-containing protein n=1 Tax=Pseudomonas nunensis TaxID=2961896 RepID=UPI0025B06396|nr:SpvB/TcaC N-terminal domain-containing protein [Pseudomonas nunensis]MDN3219121.1 SpvB/TcaC N-terminal domain-containing protein [Pseudomonas nunensis]
MNEQASGTLDITAPSLPKGGGAIQSIGKGSAGVGFTGSLSEGLALPISKAPNREWVPPLGLSYSSDVGNSPFGIGWKLTTNAITLRTSKGVPTYDGSDQIVGPGGEVWMPEKSDDDQIISREVARYRTVDIARHRVVRYWPRVEGAFDLIEHWTLVEQPQNPQDPTYNPAGFWLIHGADGSLHLYGKSPNARRADPNDKTRVSVWMIDESLNLRGEHIVYEYIAETDAPAALQFRDYRAQRYLWRVLYGNQRPEANLYAWSATGWTAEHFFFHLLFDYGERSTDLTQTPTYGGEDDWTVRSDPFWNYAYGFELGTRRLCKQVLMFHHFPAELGPNPVLVQRLLLEHRQSPLGFNHLTAAHIQACDNQGQVENRPPVEFAYNPFELDPGHPGYSEFPEMPGLNDGQLYQLTDLYGEGMPGVLFRSDKAWYYREPERGENGADHVRYGDWHLLPHIPVADSRMPLRQSLSDLTGDGKLDWVVAQPGLSGFFTLNPDRSWSNFVPYSAFPNEFFHPSAQLANLVGDGLSDLALIGPRSVRLYANLRESGFTAGENVPHDDDALPLLSNSKTELVAFSDVLGSGQQHLIRIRHNEVKCWPNLGRGRFGKGFVLCALPFDYATFNASQVLMADLDGSGATDLIYLESDRLRVFMNRAGNGYAAESQDLPWPQGVRYDRLCQVSTADLQGLGCSSLILTVPHMSPRHWRYDFVQAKPYLLNASSNNMGAVSGVTYRSSAQEWLDEKVELLAAGKAPVSSLPLTLHLVRQKTSLDEITGTRLTEGYRYRQGFYDGVEREFRGFGLLLRTDTEATAIERASLGFTAPILSKTWFHTGKAVDMREEGYYNRDPVAIPLGTTLLHEYHLNDGVGRAVVPDADLAREMARALSGSVLRTEVFAADDDPETAVPYSVQESRFLVRELKPKGNHQPYAVLQPLALESIAYQYEPQVPNDPLCQHTLNLQWNKYGVLTHGFTVHYARRREPGVGDPPFIVCEAGDDRDECHENTWWADAHDPAQQKWYLNQAKAQVYDLEAPQGWRLGLPYRQRSNALILEKAELKPQDINYEHFLERSDDKGPWAAKAVLTGLSLQRYQNPANGELLDPAPEKNAIVFEALPDYLEAAELDTTALSAYDKLKNAEGNMPFNLKEKLESPEVGYHIMDRFLPDAEPVEPVDPTDAKNYLWSLRKGFPTYQTLAGFYNVKALRQTRSHGITEVTYDEPYWCLPTAVKLPDGCITRTLNTDYRSFLPAAIEDPNQNIQEGRYNAFGEVLVTSFHGTELGEKVGFKELTGYRPPADRSPDAAIAGPNAAIGDYATATFSAPFSWMGRVSQTTPPGAPWLAWARDNGYVLPGGHLCTRARWHLKDLETPSADEQLLKKYVDEAHREPVHVATLQADRYPGDPDLQIRIAIACWDGFGRSLQAKQLVEPGKAWVAGEHGELQLNPDGTPKEEHAEQRWRVSEPVMYNNKGETVLICRPYFCNSYRRINDRAMFKFGYCDQQFYDPPGRPTRTLLAKKPLRREVWYRTWYTITFDENDTYEQAMAEMLASQQEEQ